MPTKKTKQEPIQSLINFKSKLCTNQELSDRFVSDILKITGLEIDEEGYLVNAEDDPIEPDYVLIKGKPIRYSVQGILHNKDIIFDPYNNLMIMEEIFKQYLAQCHPEVRITQIFADKPGVIPKSDTYGYMTIVYGNGATIKTKSHYKDTTKYLEAFMRLESMTDNIIDETIAPYDIYESEFFKNMK